MSAKQSSKFSAEELDQQIAVILDRRELMQKRLAELEAALLRLDARLKGLYSKRTVALNFTLPLEEAER